MDDVRNIYGIGSKKANDLKKHYNIRTISSLKNYARKIPEIITSAQHAGLKYHDKIDNTIEYDDAYKHAKFIKKVLPHSIIAGSIRRKEKKVGDIDVIVTSDIANAVKKLEDKKYIIATLAIGDEKFSGIARLPGTTNYRRIDIIRTTEEEKPFALLYFTGDFVQNISMRQKAKKLKYSLSQHGIRSTHTGKLVRGIKTEEDIFKLIGLPYKPPEKRSHKGKEYDQLTKLAKTKTPRKERVVKPKIKINPVKKSTKKRVKKKSKK